MSFLSIFSLTHSVFSFKKSLLAVKTVVSLVHAFDTISKPQIRIPDE